MASFYLLCQNQAPTTVAIILEAIREAEAQRPLETTACCIIQAMARRTSQRKKYLQLRSACIHIQRIYRGYRGRITALNQRIILGKKRWHRFYTHFAVLIQKTFRGYFSRKWRYNYHQQKAYLQEIQARSDVIRNNMQEHYQRTAEEEAKRQQSELTQSFGRITRNLHHLLSTNAIPGVFRDTRTGVSKQTIFNTDVEKTLRDLKISPKPSPSTTTLPTATTLKETSPALSLQASCPYDKVNQANRMEKKN